MKQTNKLKMITVMAVSIMVALFTASCSNDEFFGFYDESELETSLNNCIENYSELCYLDIDSCQKNYSESDYKIITNALNRIVLYRNNGITHIKEIDYDDLNMSEYLYNVCNNMITHTNGIVYRSQYMKNNKRKLNRSPEPGGVWGDCAPVAMTHVLRGTAPSLQQAYEYCDCFQPSWRTIGLYKTNAIAILNQYIASVKRCDGGVISSESKGMDNCLLLLTGDPGHAVNATFFCKGDPDWIFYCDYWAGGVLGAVQAQDCSVINSVLVWK